MIEFRGVGYTYRSLIKRRRVRAVDDFTLSIAPGEVLGLAGPNGAGKTTLIALMLGFLHPTDGDVHVDGQSPRSFVERWGVGYLSELVNLPPRWTLEQALWRLALLAGVPDSQIRPRVDGAIERLGIYEHRKKAVRQLSKGNLQRLGLAQALLRDERVLILDEPTHGLDPVWTQRFRDVAAELRRPDRVIFIASHNLDELQRLADRVAIIDRGRLQRVVAMRTAAASSDGAAPTPYLITLTRGAELVPVIFPGARETGRGEFELPASDLAAVNRGIAELLAGGALVSMLTPVHTALEQQFREAVGDRT
ncbi:MAG: ABC transporter ATP-binding protein [Gemmatimonadota bacterium]|nr:ABC transporter ATP-binding protein [Gemmatimonadota bacterium]